MPVTAKSRHLAREGKRRGQWVPCRAEHACPIGNHVPDDVFKAAQFWLREAKQQRKTTTAITKRDIDNFERQPDALTWVSRYHAHMNGDIERVYARLVTRVFKQRHTPGATQVAFNRDEITKAARALRVATPKNLGDVIYAFRYRTDLPKTISDTAAPGMTWQLLGGGRGRYVFEQKPHVDFTINDTVPVERVRDQTPAMVARHAFSSEQALLAKVRYNGMINTATGLECNSLQNHLRAYVDGWGQVETDEVYVGRTRDGRDEYVVMVEAKGGADRLSMVQLWQDQALAHAKFPGMGVKVVAIQFINERESAFFVFEEDADGALTMGEKSRFQLI